MLIQLLEISRRMTNLVDSIILLLSKNEEQDILEEIDEIQTRIEIIRKKLEK